MTGVQTCALPICFPVTIIGVDGSSEEREEGLIEDISFSRHCDEMYSSRSKVSLERELMTSTEAFFFFFGFLERSKGVEERGDAE